MKYIKSYSNDMLRVTKYGLAAIAFFLGFAPLMAQDESEAAAPAPVKKEVKKQKQYPMFEVKGKVVDAATGEALAGAQIKAYNNSYYTAMADENGLFTISVPEFVTSLQTSLEGYNIVRTPIKKDKVLVEVMLYSDRFASDYQTRTTANHTVGISDFETTTAMTADDEIRDRLGSDVRSITRSALNAQGATMFINGLNTLNANAQPLIVLDGVIYDMMYNRSEMLHTGYVNDLLSTINMDDVEDIKVMKNGTAIYGSKASNGVIIINTKRNKSMATRIDFNASFGMEFIPKTMDMMNADEYRSYASELLGTTNTKFTEFKFLGNTDPTAYDPYYNKYHNNTDWKDVVYNEAFTQNYSIHVQGGDDVANYNLSVGYMDAASTLKKNDMNRFNIRFNTDILLNKWFTTRFDASYTNITRNLRDAGLNTDFDAQQLSATNILAMVKAPFLSPYDFSTQDQASQFIASADDYLSDVLGSKASIANPLAILDNAEAKNKNHTDLTQINIAITPKWQPTKNFSLQERFSYTMQSFDERYITPRIGMPPFQLAGKGMIDVSNFSTFSKHNSVFSDTRFDWAIPLGEHRIDAFGGIRFMNDTFHMSDIRGYGYNSTNDKMPNMNTNLLYKENNGTDESWRSLSYYANIDYNYQEKYYLQGALSVETSSRFGKKVDAGMKLFGVTWGLFPSIEAAWVISNEKWFKPNSTVNYLRLSAGFESVGNDAVDNNATRTYMMASSMLGQKASTIGIANIGNTKLRWETTNRFNAGLEGNFIDNRLNIKVNYYRSKTSNLLTLGTLSYVAGLNDYWTNDGSLENEGFDFAANAKVLNLNNFKMELGASMGHYKNKLTKLPEGKTSFTTDMYGGTVISQVGSAAGLFYGYKTDGVFASSADAERANLAIEDAAGNKTYFKAGDIKFVDKNLDGVISEDDRYVIGDPNPDIYGNLSAKFFIGKHWSVGVNFNYSLGNDIYNYQRALVESGSRFLNQTTALNRRWMAEGQVTDIPRITYNDPMGNSRFSDRWIEDGSYLKLKNVTVSYKIPLQSQFIQGLTVWAAGSNLLTITRYLGNDPEVTAGNSVLMQGIDAGYLNSGRSFTLGVKINL